jgi:micrococcal nuclease
MYSYTAKLIKVIDGDTIDAMIDLGFNVWVKKRIRLAGINAYESRTRDKEEKKKGLAAKERLKQIFATDPDFRLVSRGVGKYGRCLGDVYVTKRYLRSDKYHGKSVNTALVEEGHAVKYEC